MTDREIFRENLNFYLQKHNVMQKDLAEYVGSKTATVSGWTRGISYPRADAMEKIAMFFGIKTSELVGERHPDSDTGNSSQHENVQLFIQDIHRMKPEDVDKLREMSRLMFATSYPDLFKKGSDDENKT